MNSQTSQRWIGSILGALSLFYLSACSVIASEDKDGNGGKTYSTKGAVASVKMTPSAIHWRPHVSYASISLTVSGPEGVTTSTFKKGSKLVLHVKDEKRTLVDGLYKYELRVTPEIDDKTRKKLLKARETGDSSIVTKLRRSGALPSGPQQQSGHFRIVSGSVYIDTTPEKDYESRSKQK